MKQAFVYEVAVLELQSRAGKYLEILSDDALRLLLSLNDQACAHSISTLNEPYLLTELMAT